MDRVKSKYEGLLLATTELLQVSASSQTSQAERSRATQDLEAAYRAFDDACEILQRQLVCPAMTRDNRHHVSLSGLLQSCTSHVTRRTIVQHCFAGRGRTLYLHAEADSPPTLKVALQWSIPLNIEVVIQLACVLVGQMEVEDAVSTLPPETSQPDYIRNPQRLPMSHELFTEGNLARELLAKQTLQSCPNMEVGSASGERKISHRRAGARPPDWPSFQCTSCQLQLPNAHLLDIHILEVHDSFFAAQAARRMKVFRCLVEGCSRAFHTAAERSQHLYDHHRYPRGFHYETMHLGRRQGQHRPDEHFRRAAPGCPESMDSSAAADCSTCTGQPEYDGAAAEQRTAGALEQTTRNADGVKAAHSAAAKQKAPDGDGNVKNNDSVSMEVDELAGGMSRLSTAAADMTFVPRSVSFGRKKQGLGRGR